MSSTAAAPSYVALSAVVITRNEAARIGRCLESVKWCDEMIVVDSGSTDETAEIARNAGARVISHEWEGYGGQKGFAVGQARNNWVLCVDADEVVTPELRSGIEAILGAPPHFAYEMARCNRFMGRYLRHGEGYPDWIVRLFDRRHARWSQDAVHEHVRVDGAIGRIGGDLLHDSAESLHAYLEKQNAYTTLQSRALHDQGTRPSVLKLALSPSVRFVKFYVLRLGFLDGVPGLVHIAIGCFNTFSKNAKLFALWMERHRDPRD